MTDADRLADLLARREVEGAADYGGLAGTLRAEVLACVRLEQELSALSLAARGHPERAGPWVLLRPLGGGDTGPVYLAEREDEPVRAAVRLLRGPVRERALDTARRALSFRHPSVASVLDAGDGFVAAAPTGGVPLSRILLPLRRDPPVNPREAALPLLRALAPVARGVAAAHAEGLAHGGISPGKVDFAAGGRLVLRDFGLPGSAAFAAPEVAAGDPPRPAADARGLAALAFSVATGTPPFAARSRPALLARIRREDLPPVRSLAPWLPAPCAASLDAALARDPDARPEVPELAGALESL